MAFLDDFGKKISQVGQTAVQKTRDITDIARINSLIADEEKQVNSIYYQIGKLYVTFHRSDFEGEFAEMFDAVRKSEAKITEYRKQIRDIKGVVWCEKCGAEITSNSAFCSACGSPVQQAEEADNAGLIKCGSCGAILNEDMNFCTYCGKSRKDMVANEDATIVEEIIEEKVVNKCPSCGTEFDEKYVFCTKCGTKIN